MNKYSPASFSIKTVATFSSTLADEADRYYLDECKKEGYIVNREYHGSKIIITSKAGFRYIPDFEYLSKYDEKYKARKALNEMKRYRYKKQKERMEQRKKEKEQQDKEKSKDEK